VAQEVETVLSLPTGTELTNVAVGGFVVFQGDGVDEICSITSFTASTVTLKRGCLDTYPLAWPTGTKAWMFSRSHDVWDESEILAGDTVNYKLLPITSARRLAIEDATAHEVAVSDRHYLPLRPANIAVDGDNTFPFTTSAGTSGGMNITWSNRNRLTETSDVLAWTDSTVTPETNQTTSVRIKKNGNLLYTFDGIITNNVSIDLEYVTRTPGEVWDIEIWAERDGLQSYVTCTFPITFV
jgi:hypothetical protein